MPLSNLRVPAEVRGLSRRLHLDLKRKVRAALTVILEDPSCGKLLKDRLRGYRSLRVGQSRIIYRLAADAVEVVAVGPRESIYEDAARQILRAQDKRR